MARKKNSQPQPGDLVLVRWEDIAGGEHGTPETPVFETPGYFVGWVRRGGRRYLDMGRSRLIEGSSEFNVGWDTYPAAVVKEVVKV